MKVKIITTIVIGLVVVGGLTLWLRSKSEDAGTKVASDAYFPVPNIAEGPIITFNFDDGYESAYKLGVPIMEASGFKTSHYIVINRMGEKGYMSRRQVLDLQTRGHEIGAHSLTHTILTEMSLAKARKEIFESKAELLDLGVTKIATFVYPDGYFNNDVVNLVKEAGYSGARITNPGLNDQITNPYELLYLGMNSEISFDKVRQTIDEVITKKKWLIMVFHKIGESGYENVSADFVQRTVDYVREKKVPVVTTAQGLFIVKNIPR